jgi:DNA-directed RNA polymerase alpha subunit
MMTDFRKLCTDVVRYWDADNQIMLRHTIDEMRLAIQGSTLLVALGLPAQLYNPLRRAGFRTVEELQAADLQELMKIRNYGPMRVGCVMAYLRKYMERTNGPA